ncbi:hypothetical protein HanRHA438_Chr07g0314391 [Helianthus annuus]|nr:hypothetical protein HanRHA438_Chr07g0314391 [Helianthus annuus]
MFIVHTPQRASRVNLVEHLLNTEFGSEIGFDKRCRKLIPTCHPNSFRSCRIVKRKPTMRP